MTLRFVARGILLNMLVEQVPEESPTRRMAMPVNRKSPPVCGPYYCHVCKVALICDICPVVRRGWKLKTVECITLLEVGSEPRDENPCAWAMCEERHGVY